MRRKKRPLRSASSASQNPDADLTSKRGGSQSVSRRRRNETQITDFRKQLLATLAQAIRKTMEDLPGTEIAKISNYTPSQISMMANDKLYFDMFSIEKILSMMLNFYNMKLIIGDFCAIEKEKYNAINIHLMNSPR